MNALQACRRGGHVELRVRLAQIRHPGEATSRTWVVVDVADDGEGMPPEVQARVFEPFFTTKAPGEGTGLGLAVAWGIAADHEGWLSVESTEGVGTLFSLMLPVDERISGASPSSTAKLEP